MKEIPFVKPEELEVARAMEEKILRLPETVVSFVGVSVTPSLDDQSTYNVFVGCPRGMEPVSCSLAVTMELRKHWKTEVLAITGCRGIVRAEKVDGSLAD